MLFELYEHIVSGKNYFFYGSIYLFFMYVVLFILLIPLIIQSIKSFDDDTDYTKYGKNQKNDECLSVSFFGGSFLILLSIIIWPVVVLVLISGATAGLIYVIGKWIKDKYKIKIIISK